MATTPYLTFARRPVEWSAARTMLLDYLDWLAEHVTVDVPAAYWDSLQTEVDTLPTVFAEPNRLLVAWIGPVPVGTLGARDHEGVAELTRFYVRPIARGQGIAEVLIGTMLAELRRAGYRQAVLETAPADMQAAYRLYQRFGFVQCDEQPECPGIVRMELDLDRLPGSATSSRGAA